MTTALTIRDLKCTPVSVPLTYPIRTASGDVTHAPLLLLDLITEEGVTGHGYLFTYTPLALGPVCSLVEGLAEVIKGAPCSPHDVEKALNARFTLLGNTGLITMAIAGIDMVVWDALAKSAGLTLSTLLGGAPKPVPAYFSQGMDGLERGVELAHECVSLGYKTMKIKIGYPSLDEDIAVIQAVQSALAGNARLAVDFNQSLSLPEAIARCSVLDEMDLAWIEEPTLQEDIQGHARLAEVVQTPIMVGENWFGTHEMARSVAAESSDLVMPDLMKIGGVSGWLRASTIAREARLPMCSHLFQEVTAHLMCVTPTAFCLEILDIAGPILSTPLHVEDGFAMPSQLPGSGLEWNMEAISQYQLS